MLKCDFRNMPLPVTLIPSSTLTRHLNALESSDKIIRKKSLEELKSDLIVDNSSTFEEKVTIIYKQILRCFCDPVETCREAAINIIFDILRKIHDSNETYFPLIIPIMVQRLGHIEIVEPSEEVRLLLTELCHFIVKKFHNCVAQYVEEIVQILLKTLNDPFPKIKKESCDCVGDLSMAFPRQMYSYTALLVKPVLENMKHQHSRVRVSAIDAIGEIFLRGDSKAMEPVLVPLAERLFDQAPSVRSAIIRAVGNWMVNMPDRYSFFARHLPLLLSGLHDTVADIRDLTTKLWAAAGNQYLVENEENLKDKIDYSPEFQNLYNSKKPPRACLGCRVLACRFLHWLIPALAQEIRDWRADVRLRAAQLMCTLAELAEVRCAHYLPAIFDALSTGCEDEDQRVAYWAEQAAEAVGSGVPAESWARTLLPENVLGEETPSRGRLLVLAAVTRASPARCLCPLLPRLARTICGPPENAPEGPSCVDAQRRAAALKACEALLAAAVAGQAFVTGVEGADASDSDGAGVAAVTSEDESHNASSEATTSQEAETMAEKCPSAKGCSSVDAGLLQAVEEPLFRALFVLLAFSEDQPFTQRTQELLQRLTVECGGGLALWKRQLPPLLVSLRCPLPRPVHQRLLETLLVTAAGSSAVADDASRAMAASFDRVAVAVAAAAAFDRPPEVRARALTLMGAVLAARPQLVQGQRPAARLLRDALAPGIVWRAGRAAEAVRAAAVACLDALLLALWMLRSQNETSKTHDGELDVLTNAKSKNGNISFVKKVNGEGIVSNAKESVPDKAASNKSSTNEWVINEIAPCEVTECESEPRKMTKKSESCEKTVNESQPDKSTPKEDELGEAELTVELVRLVPQLTAASEDTCGTTRMLALRCVPLVLHVLDEEALTAVEPQHIDALLQGVLRRLDDVDDAVRSAALHCVEPLLQLLWRTLGDIARTSFDAAVDVLLVHLDDPQQAFREDVLNTLALTGRLYPSTLQTKISAEKRKFRNISEVDKLLRIISQVSAE